MLSRSLDMQAAVEGPGLAVDWGRRLESFAAEPIPHVTHSPPSSKAITL